jgi:hypothetical protein
MYKTLFASALVALALSACGGPKDIKLSEMNEPKNSKALLENLTPEEQTAVRKYVVRHTMKGDLDYNLTIKQVLEANKEEEKLKDRSAEVANQIK